MMQVTHGFVRVAVRPAGILYLCLLLASCQSPQEIKDRAILAEAFGEVLYEQDVPRSIYEQADPEQRRIKLQNYARQWIRERVLLKEALPKMELQLGEINRMTEDYRISLITYKYQEWLVDLYLDTLVSDDDLKDHYNQNTQNFSLKKNIVRLDFAKLPVDAPGIAEAAVWMKRYGYEDSVLLHEYCVKYALNYYFDDGSWLYFSDVNKEVPLKYYDEEVFLRSNKFVELRDARYVYLLLIRDYRIKNSISPYEMEKQTVRQIILNQRKRKLLDRMEQKMLESATLKGDVKEYSR